MSRGQVQSQRAGDGCLTYAAFAHDKCQLRHLAIVCGKALLPQIYADKY